MNSSPLFFLAKLRAGSLVRQKLLVALLFTVSNAFAAISFVQVNSAVPQSSPTSVAVKYTSAQTAGNLNVVVVGWNDSTATVSSVSDSAGNVYQRAVGPTTVAGFLSQSIYYAANIVSSAANTNTVTVQFSVGAAFPDIRILEYSGADQVNPVDATAGASGNNASSNSGAAITTTATDLIFGAGTTTSRYTGPGSGFTQRIITAPDGDIAEDRLVTAVGSYSAVAPNTSGRWVMQMVAFRTPSGVADTTPPTAPTAVSATSASSSQINLSWTASTDNVGVTQYLIERCQGASCSSFAQVGSTGGTTFNDTGLTASTSYRYRVRASDASNNLSGFSNIASATTSATSARGLPVFIAEAHSATDGGGAAFNESTLSINVSGPNPLLMVAFHAEFDGGFPDNWTVTDNGVAGTSLVQTNGYTGADGNRLFRIYYWLNPPAGTNTVVVSLHTTIPNELAVSTILFNHVSQTSPFGTPVLDVSTTARTGESETVPTTTTDLVLHVIADALLVTGNLGSGETSISLANDGGHPQDGDASLWISTKPGSSGNTTVSSSGWASRTINGVGIAVHGTM